MKFDWAIFGNLVAREVARVSYLPMVLPVGQKDESLGTSLFI